VSNANFSWGFKEKTPEEKKAIAAAAMAAGRGGRGGRGGGRGGRGGGRGRGIGPPPPTIEEVSTPTLVEIDFSAKKGSLTCVVGKIGSGKSSLLAGLLAEMTVSQSDEAVKTFGYQIKGRTAYISQSAWIQNLTLRENILFGKPYNKEKYDRIIKACALGPDLAILPSGDSSEIGEAGGNLSGGQKQRVAIARACYQDADVYLFDDPLSAVDPEVGNHIFEQCICGILKDKTRLLVTHGLHFLPTADYVLCIDNGKIQDQGTHSELCAREGAPCPANGANEETDKPEHSILACTHMWFIL
jgi:ABC-type multidrug transport system fused ATPase/permease subunit